MAQYEMNLRDYWLIVRRRRMIIITSTALVALLSLGLARQKVPNYQATAAVKYEQSTQMSGLLVEVLSYSSAEDLAAQHPQDASQITAAAKQAFLDGDQWAYIAAMVAVLIGMALVFRFFPKRDDEEALRAAYHAQDQGAGSAGAVPPVPVPAEGSAG